MPFFVFVEIFVMPFFFFLCCLYSAPYCLYSAANWFSKKTQSIRSCYAQIYQQEFHKSLNYIYTNIYINCRFVHLLTWWQPAHREPPPCSIFPASHILKAREKILPMGNSLGKYKTTDTAGISFLFYHYHENPICTIGTTRLITL